MRDAGLQVTVRTTGTPLPAPADSLFTWVLREATTNVIRHSHASRCEIDVRRMNGRATLEVSDNGIGRQEPMTDPAQSAAASGRGLDGLAERLAEAGGRLETGEQLEVGEQPGTAGRPDPDGTGGRGWRVAATVPVTSPDEP